MLAPGCAGPWGMPMDVDFVHACTTYGVVLPSSYPLDHYDSLWQLGECSSFLSTPPSCDHFDPALSKWGTASWDASVVVNDPAFGSNSLWPLALGKLGGEILCRSSYSCSIQGSIEVIPEDIQTIPFESCCAIYAALMHSHLSTRINCSYCKLLGGGRTPYNFESTSAGF